MCQLICCVHHPHLFIMSACVLLKKHINKDSSMRVHQNTWGSVTGTEIWLRKRQRGSDAGILNGVPMWMLADVQTNGSISSVHVQWFSHWQIRSDNHDIIS